VGEALGAVLALAAGVALSPVPIIAVVLVLTTPRGRPNGVAFLVGWIVGLGGVGTLVLLLSGEAGVGAAATTGIGVAELVLGVALLALAVVQWRRRQAISTAGLPAWLTSLDTATPARAGGLGVVLAAVNPKNLLLTVAAAAAISASGADPGDQAVALAVFVALATVGPAVPVVIRFALRRRSTAVLSSLRAWMTVHNTVIVCVLLAVIGLKLIGDGTAALSG
jgi:threonine/homoserine/homoserine lactone efflux protein